MISLKCFSWIRNVALEAALLVWCILAWISRGTGLVSLYSSSLEPYPPLLSQVAVKAIDFPLAFDRDDTEEFLRVR